MQAHHSKSGDGGMSLEAWRRRPTPSACAPGTRTKAVEALTSIKEKRLTSPHRASLPSSPLICPLIPDAHLDKGEAKVDEARLAASPRRAAGLALHIAKLLARARVVVSRRRERERRLAPRRRQVDDAEEALLEAAVEIDGALVLDAVAPDVPANVLGLSGDYRA